MSSNKKGIGFSPLTDKIYLGKQDQKKRIWIGDKEDITNDFINVMFKYVPQDTTRTIRGLDTDSKNIFINVKNDPKSIEKAIKYLTEKLNP